MKFFSTNCFMTHVMNIIHESLSWEFITDEYIQDVPTKEQFVARFVGKFINPKKAPIEAIEGVYESLTDEQRKRVFYKCYLKAFLMQPNVRKLVDKIAGIPVEFIDPNKIPAELIEPVSKLQDVIREFVFYKHSVYKYEDRSKSLPRQSVTTVDTDS